MNVNKIKSIGVKILRKYGLKPPLQYEEIPQERIEAVRLLSSDALKNDKDIKRVEICILKYKEDPEVINPALSDIVHNTSWPFKLNVYDNRPNPPNMSKMWNRFIKESTCDYICIIDSDAYVPDLSPCWLTRMMESIDSMGVVVPLGDNVTGINKATSAESYPSSKLQEGIWTGFCFLVKREVALLEPFDEEFFIYGQDTEWAMRLSKKFGGVEIRRDVLVKHLHNYSTRKAHKKGEIDRVADTRYSAQLLAKKHPDFFGK